MKGALAIFRRIDLRHVSRRRLRTALTIAGIASGVALLFSISVINATLLASFRAGLRSIAGQAEIEVAATGAAGLTADAVERAAAVDGVQRAVPVFRSMTTLTGGRGERRILVLGVTPEILALFPDTTPIGSELQDLLRLDGSFGSDGRGLVLAAGLAEELRVSQGDPTAIETPSGGAGLVVTGLLGGGGVDLFNGGDVGVMLLPAAQAAFDRPDAIDSVYVVADPTGSLDDIEASLRAEFEGRAIVGQPGERGRGLERVFASLGTLLSMGGTVALFVSLFVVYNTMSMSLAERRREISMVLALGAKPAQVFAASLAQAALLGAAAVALGLAGGLALARVLVVQTIDDFRVLSINASGPLALRPAHFVVAAVAGLLVSVAGAYLPARRILRVPPVEALQPVAVYEWEPASHGSGRLPVFAGAGGIAIATALLVAFLVFPEERWIVTAGLLAGLGGISFLLPGIVPLAFRIVRPALTRGFGAVGRLAADAIGRNPRRSTFTVAALVLTLGLVVGVATALGSYERRIRDTATSLFGAPIYVTSNSYTGLTSDQPLREELGAKLEAVEGVRHVYPLRFALIDLGGEQALLYAIPVEQALAEGATTQLGAITEDPQGFLDGLADGGLIASRLASDRLGVEVGDRLSLPTPRGARSFEIEGLFDDLLSFNSFYVDRAVYERLWKEGVVDEFGILLEPGASVSAVKERLQGTIDAEDAPARAYRAEELLERILEIVGGTFDLARGVQLAALLVAALTIANTMFTAVLERRWEMGLERAIGMGDAQLSRTVLVEAGAIGLVGGAGGTILGVVSGFFMTQAMEAEFSWRVPFVIPRGTILVALVGGIAIASLAGSLPSRLATRTPIIESLRYE